MEMLEIKLEAVRLKETGLFSATQQFTGTQAAPIYLNVDTGVDYTAIATAFFGFIVAVVVARFTVSVQRNQIQANVSNFRHQWMVELRESASELVQVAAVMINGRAQSNDYRTKGDYRKDYSRALQLRAKVEMLLSRDDDQSREVRATCGAMLKKINAINNGDNVQEILSELVDYQNLIRRELEGAWSDTKNDLGINKRAFGFKLFKKE